MLKDLTEDQRALAQYMSDLSEEAYYAGWMEGLEYALWQVVLGERSEYGLLTFSPEHVSELRRLSASCAGWIAFEDEVGETWVSQPEWERRFSGWWGSLAAKHIDE
jgi:hypothetical protein